LDVANDLLFVCDYSNHRISVFRASDGLFVRTFGGQPRLQTPVGIAFGLNGDVYVTQYELHRVAVFNSFDGRFLRHFPSDSEAAPVANAETLSNPYGVVVDGEGNVLIGDYANKRVAMFRGDGTFVRAIGGDGGAKLEGPQGLALDDDGRLWITDITTGRIHMYS
jgi:streptogramin lyase